MAQSYQIYIQIHIYIDAQDKCTGLNLTYSTAIPRSAGISNIPAPQNAPKTHTSYIYAPEQININHRLHTNFTVFPRIFIDTSPHSP